MISGSRHPFPHDGVWKPSHQLLELNKPRHEVVADFIYGCSTDPAVRTVATTALVLSLWQRKGTALTKEDVPSIILVHDDESNDDPIDDFIQSLVYHEQENEPGVKLGGAFSGMPVDMAPKIMENAYRQRRELEEDTAVDPVTREDRARNEELRFQKAKETLYGRCKCRPYAEAFHPEYGLLTDERNHLILRLNNGEDRRAFFEDLSEAPGRLSHPRGAGPELEMVPKQISLSGSLKPEEWGGKILESAVESLGPVFALPHQASDSLKKQSETAIRTMTMLWESEANTPLETPRALPSSEWIVAYETGLRRRLRSLPGDYEFAMLRAVRRLGGVCDRIGNFVFRGSLDDEGKVALFLDLYSQALRGMVLGVVGLSWHGLGLYLGPEGEGLRDEAFRLVRFLRKEGETSKSAILQRCHLKKVQRDLLLEVLSAEDMVRVEGNVVSATSYSEFVTALYERKEFPPMPDHWKTLLKRREETDSAG